MKKVQIFKLKKKVNFETGQNRPKKFANVIYLTYPTMSKNISLENRLELKKISILSFKKNKIYLCRNDGRNNSFNVRIVKMFILSKK